MQLTLYPLYYLPHDSWQSTPRIYMYFKQGGLILNEDITQHSGLLHKFC